MSTHLSVAEAGSIKDHVVCLWGLTYFVIAQDCLFSNLYPLALGTSVWNRPIVLENDECLGTHLR